MYLKLKEIWKALILLGLTINTIFPFDKILILPYIIISFIKTGIIQKEQLFIILSIFIVAFLSFCINSPNSNYEIFYPGLWIWGAFVISKSNINLLLLRNIFFVNVLFGIIFLILAYKDINTMYVMDLDYKGFSLEGYAIQGFSPTPQVFGTFCILHLIISFEYKKFDLPFYITIVSLILSYNRASILFFVILFLIYKRKLFFMILIPLVLFIIKSKQIVEDLFSSSTLLSRDELRKGVYWAYWQSNDTLVKLFGFGNTNTTNYIAYRTLYGRTYIENGLDFIFYCFGIVGFILFIVLLSSFLIKLIKDKQWKILIIVSYYMLITQWLTQEFLASSFMFFWVIIFKLIKQKSSYLSANTQLFPSPKTY